MKTCYSISDLAFPIKIEQSESGKRLFRVTYGKQVKIKLTYSEACKKTAESLFHALCCEGLASNEGK